MPKAKEQSDEKSTISLNDFFRSSRMRNDADSKRHTGNFISSLWVTLFGANRGASSPFAEQIDSASNSAVDHCTENSGAIVQPEQHSDRPECGGSTDYSGSNDWCSSNGSAVLGNPSIESHTYNQVNGESTMTTDTNQSVAQTVAQTALSTAEQLAPVAIAAGVGAAAIANPSAAAGIGVALQLMPQAIQVSQTLMNMMQAPNVNKVALLQLQANLYAEMVAAQKQWDAENAAQNITAVNLEPPVTAAAPAAPVVQTVATAPGNA